jgi:hypothetical protein
MKAQSAEVTAMQYGFMQTIPLPDETYEEVHAQVTAAAGERVPGLYVHFARSTPNGYQLVEVWESKQHYDRFFEQVVNPIVERVTAGRPMDGEPVTEEFEVHWLRIQTDHSVPASTT